MLDGNGSGKKQTFLLTTLPFLTDSELVVIGNWFAAVKVNLDSFFALYLRAGFIVKGVGNLSCFAINDVAA
jgi:hypothetical protein